MIAAAWRRYWFEFSVARRRLGLWRIAFFGLLAYDLWFIMLGHAPRFGAGGFNVSQVPALDAYLPVPTPERVGPLYLLGGFLALCIALGAAPYRALLVLAPVYAGTYLWSQADSYQHHYLLALVLVLLCFAPADTLAGSASTPPDEAAGGPAPPAEPARVRSWALRLIYVQIGLMYAWTAVTKHTPAWLDGSTLGQIVTCAPRERIHGAAAALGIGTDEALRLAALAVMVGEYVAGALYLARPLWVVGLFLIPAFHLGVEWLGLDIELFSLYMIGTNVLLLMPDRWLFALTEPLARRMGLRLGRTVGPCGPPSVSTSRARWAAVGLGALAAAGGALTPYAGAPLSAALLGLAALWLAWPAGTGGAATPGAWLRIAVAALCLPLGAMTADTAYTYYRQWGGYLKRTGDAAGAEDMYARANAAAHGHPGRHLQLARLRLKAGHPDEAAALLDEDLRRQTAERDALAAGPPRSAADFQALGLAERAIADAAEALAGVAESVGRGEEVAGLRTRRAAALAAARAAFQRNMELDPVCGEGRAELGRLGGGHLGEAESSP